MIFKIPEKRRILYTWTIFSKNIEKYPHLFLSMQSCIKDLLTKEKNFYDAKNKKYIIIRKDKLKRKYRLYTVKTTISNIVKNTKNSIIDINKAKVEYEEDYLENLLKKYKIKIEIKDINKLSSERKKIYDKAFSHAKIELERIIKRNNLDSKCFNLFAKEYDKDSYDNHMKSFLSGNKNYIELIYFDISKFLNNSDVFKKHYDSIIELVIKLDKKQNSQSAIKYFWYKDKGSIDNKGSIRLYITL